MIFVHATLTTETGLTETVGVPKAFYKPLRFFPQINAHIMQPSIDPSP
jgi:hypothetical protein